MKFSVNLNQFNQGLTKVSRLASTRMPMPILNNILIEAEEGMIGLSATDLEIGIHSVVPAESVQAGRFTVPARLLQEFVQSSGEQTLVGELLDNSYLTLKGNQSQVKIRGQEAGEFPSLPFSDSQPTFELSAGNLKEGLEAVLFAAATDDTRPVLSGVLLTGEKQTLTLAATDSYRLAERQIQLNGPVSQPFSVIVPKRTILEIVRLISEAAGDVSVFVGDNQVELLIDETRLVSRLIEGTYPPYQSIVPNEYRTRVTADAGELSSALKTSQLFAREVGNLITLTMAPGQGVTVQAAGSQTGEATNQFTAITEGDGLTIGFNAKFLLDALAAAKADNLFLEFNGADRPVVVRPANSKGYFSLVMPLKLD